MAVAALIIMNESKQNPAPPKYPKKTYVIFDDPDVNATHATNATRRRRRRRDDRDDGTSATTDVGRRRADEATDSPRPLARRSPKTPCSTFPSPRIWRASSKASSTPATLRRSRACCLWSVIAGDARRMRVADDVLVVLDVGCCRSSTVVGRFRYF